MSDKEKKEATGDEAEAPKKSKKKLIIFIVIGVVVVALAGVGAMLMMGKKKSPDGEGEGEETAQVEEKEEEHAAPPVYLKLEPFTTNLAMDEAAPAGTGGQYIQVVVEMKLEDAKAEEALKAYTPEIRNNILRLLSSKHAAELSSTEGKDRLAEEIGTSVNKLAGGGEKKKGKGHDGPVQSVLFSSFIIQ